MKLMTKIFCLTLCFLLFVGMLVACDSEDSKETTEDAPESVSHEHSFGEWTTLEAATCTEEGSRQRSCSTCSEIETEAISAAGHKYVDQICATCNKPERYSEGLEFRANEDGTCVVSGLGTCTDTELFIPPTTPEGAIVTGIGSLAFYNCGSLTRFVLPDTITSIGYGAFLGTAYYEEQSNWENGVLYLGNCLIEVKGTVSGVYTVKAGTTMLADEAFYNCKSVTGVEFPDSVTSIGKKAFYGCSSLASIEIPDGVKKIGDSMFEWCEGLKSIVIPNGVTMIGNSAFLYCQSLTDIYFAGIEAEWNEIDKPYAKLPDNATVHFNYVPSEA